jgi:hypothetical protein
MTLIPTHSHQKAALAWTQVAHTASDSMLALDVGGERNNSKSGKTV